MVSLQWKKSGHKARIYLDGEWWMTLEEELIERLQLEDGRIISEEEKEILTNLAQREKSQLFVLRSLSVRAQTRAELEKKLELKKIQPDVISLVLDTVAGWGFINDEEVARGLFEGLVSRGYGKRRAMMKIREKGIDPELGERLLEEIFPPEDEVGLARKALKGRKASGDIKEQQKLVAFLIRRGFSYDAARTVLKLDQEQD